MLTKEYRLTLDKDIKKVLQNGNSFFTKFLNFKILKTKLNQTRFVIIISKKVNKCATTRNKIKRQISEIIRLNSSKLKPNYDISITVKNSIINPETKKNTYNYHDIEKNILWAFNKIGLDK